ncbi:MAG: protein kinase domain-containing protein [Nannocystaceae bacterium]|nr:tetratricopeptide repeat protein [bacterium]
MTDGVEEDDALLDEHLERGTSVDRYVVLYELGSGGMGVVYAAYDPQLDRKVALKLLQARSRSDRARTRLLREAKAIARITHPNVVTVHDVGTYEGRVFVAMEYVEGLTLRRWLQERRRDWPEVLGVLCDAGRGLAAAHEGDLIHRDFKPDNVLVEEGGRAVVLDFGLARRTSSQEYPLPRVSEDGSSSVRRESIESEPDLTRTGAKLGTPAYMAPEQHLSSPTDARTDQFSFCVVLWEALYGVRPFAGSTAREARYSVLKGEILEPRESEVPAAIRRVLERGLSLDPDSRHDDMEALLSALASGARRRVPRWVLGAGGAAASLGLASFAWASTTDAEESPCIDPAQRWVSVWDDDTQATVRSAFVGSGAKYAAAAWGTVSSTLDRYTDAWSLAHLDSCEATNVHREQSPETLELRMSCLRARHQAVAALVREFSEADAAVVENAVDAVNALPRLAECSDLARLQSGPVVVQSVDIHKSAPLRESLVDARAKESSARFRQAEAIVLRVLDTSERIGATDVAAEARLRMGSIEERRSEFAEAERSYLEAIWAAQRVGHRYVEAEAWVRLVWVTGVERFDPERGQLWAEFAQAALDRAGGAPVLEAQLRHNVGGVLYTLGRHDEALAEYRLALSRQRELLGESDPRVATTLNHIGNALMELERFDESEVSCRRSLDIRKRLFGDQHPAVAAVLNNLGELERKRAHPDNALEHALASLEIVGNTGGREEDFAAMIAGWALLELGRPKEALPRFERTLAMRTDMDGAFSPRVVDVEYELARTRVALGEHDVALAQLDRVLELEAGRRDDVVARARSLRDVVLRQRPQTPPSVPSAGTQ